MGEKKNISFILDELKRLGDPERAKKDLAYHKSSREHWGVIAAHSDQVVRSLSKELTEEGMIQVASDLWATDLFDPMMCAARLLSLPKIKPSKALWKTMIGFLKKVDGWALEDTLAHVAWKCILKDASHLDEIEEWTKHPNFWMRRAALVYTLPLAKPGRDPERSLKWASTYAPDPEWFIQKAIGWWLRVLGEHNPVRVVAFLNAHWDQLKSVARRESTRKLDKLVLNNLNDGNDITI